MNNKKTYGIPKHDIFTDQPIDLNELVEKLAHKLADSNSGAGSKKKMSYSISSFAQALIKKVAQETGATQGSIVEAAPLLFAKMAINSLERRSKALGTLRTLEEQILRSLDSFAKTAPHLKAYTDQVAMMVKEITAMEKEAVANRNIQGVDTVSYPFLNSLKIQNKQVPPYNQEIKNFLGDDDLFASFSQNHQD